MIHDGQRSRFVPVGGRIGEAELIALRPALGYLRGADGVVCELRLTLPRDQRRVTRAPKIAALRAATIRKAGSKATAKGLFSAAELDAGIKSVGAKHHRVSRELLQRGLKNPVQLVKGTRFRPFKRAGRTVGMRVYGVRKDSVLYRLGVRSGDVLRSLNGYDVASPDGMLQAYTLLRQQREFTVALLRRGRDEMLRYSVE
jgi:general secretion pathway protein C